jgi:hypothetical protein
MRDSILIGGALGAIILAPALFGYGQQLADSGLPPHTPSSRDDFLASRFPEYSCYRYLNGLGTPFRVFGFFDERMTYYANGERIGDYFGPARYSGMRRETGRELLESLRPLGADYVLFPTGLARPPSDSSFEREFRLVCAVPAARLYAVKRE